MTGPTADTINVGDVVRRIGADPFERMIVEDVRGSKVIVAWSEGAEIRRATFTRDELERESKGGM